MLMSQLTNNSCLDYQITELPLFFKVSFAALPCIFCSLTLCSLFSGMVSLLANLRDHFAEFLNNASPVGLRILSSSTCVGLRYGHI